MKQYKSKEGMAAKFVAVLAAFVLAMSFLPVSILGTQSAWADTLASFYDGGGTWKLATINPAGGWSVSTNPMGDTYLSKRFSDDVVLLTDTNIEKDGYVLLGWQLSGQSTVLSPGSTVQVDSGSANLTPVWGEEPTSPTIAVNKTINVPASVDLTGLTYTFDFQAAAV